jgi:glycosyltransferase involved in cell wall biosynthesis
VLLDATAGARREASGVGRYVHSLVRALAELAARGEAPPFELGVRFAKRSGRRFLPEPRARLVDDRLDWLLLRDVGLFHGLDARITPSRRPARVATLHDLFSLERDDLADAGFRAKKQADYRRLADEADRVICVSAATEATFLAQFPQARGRTVVVHHGVDPRFRRPSDAELQATRARLGLARPYLLFVGLLSTRKNLLALIDAFAALSARTKGEGLELVLAGAPSHGFEPIAAALERHPARDRIRRLGFVADADLPSLYAGAELLVFPSLSEGFGLPVLEAFACGTPVVASDVPALREIGGQELIVCDATRVDALAAAIDSALARPPDRARRARLVAHAGRFTWERAARETVAAWEAARERRR